MSAIKQSALNEPLVDVVDGRAVVTGAHCIKEIDLATVTKEELAFASEF